MAVMIFNGMSETGLKRRYNEDSILIRPERGLIGVADGMGGAAAGEIASRIFTETALATFPGAGPEGADGVLKNLQESFLLAHQRILAHASEHPDCKGMGCTAELMAFFEGKFALGHVGDSRAYLFRNGDLKQLTKDHSLVQDEVDSGLITPSDARKHPLRHVILRAVGTQGELAVDLVRGRVMPGDMYLLCTDGLTDMVEDGTIVGILSAPSDITRKVERLIDAAISAGGLDNITVAIGEVLE